MVNENLFICGDSVAIFKVYTVVEITACHVI